MKTVILNNKEYTIQYRITKVNDLIYDMLNECLYIASIHDADDLNWIVISS